MSTRRNVVKAMAMAPLAGALSWSNDEVATAARAVEALGQQPRFTPKFFTPHEWRTVRILVDMIIPRDPRSGSATEARVPEFMDFVLNDGSDERKMAVHGGLSWLDRESRKRFGRAFAAATPQQRGILLDEIAWPAKAKPGLTHGVSFFNSFRDLTASGFFSSRMGVEDLRYIGNIFLPKWEGCPEAALKKLGVSY